MLLSRDAPSHIIQSPLCLLSAVVFSAVHDTAGSGLLWSVRWNEGIGADQTISENTQRLRLKAEECTSDRRYLWQGRLWLLARKDKQSVFSEGALSYWCTVCKTRNCKILLGMNIQPPAGPRFRSQSAEMFPISFWGGWQRQILLKVIKKSQSSSCFTSDGFVVVNTLFVQLLWSRRGNLIWAQKTSQDDFFNDMCCYLGYDADKNL